jgi:hypothetical protein
MIKSVIILVFSLFFFQQSIQLKHWKPKSKHAWTDFRGFPPNGDPRPASSIIGFSYSYEIKRDTLIFKCITDFNCTASWYRKEKASPALLKHEDLHFDIGESYCRGLKKLVKETSFAYTDFKQKIDNIVKYVYKEVADYQRAYDQQTDHARIQKEQQKWEHKVFTDLLSLKQYSDSIVKVKMVK